ncbi:hypothetical protein FSP39_022851 [Pinctada imbricata]|uniref:Uncharacterized protein n=1 Tax=Pinctada imbricata TaxID=66713 RepID=A0AA88XXV5_PINIB|nr:hypothetical protein FSP39_022851 [Pinctada imbricata]
MDRLITDLSTGYNSKIRPPDNTSETLYVNVYFFLLSVMEYDEISGVLSLTGGLYMNWQDPRLTWTPSAYSGIPLIVLPRSDVWSPDAYVINTSDQLEAMDSDKHYVLRILHTGFVFIGIGDTINVQCSSDMTYFPFDKQTCHIIIGIWGYLAREVYLKSISSVMDTLYYTPGNIWDMESTFCEDYTMANTEGLFKCSITLARKPLYVCLNILGPIIFLSILNPLVFLLPPDSGDRVSFSMTVLLSFAVFMMMVSDNMPKTSSPMASITPLLFAVFVFSGFTTMVTMLNLRLHLAEKSDKASHKLQRIVTILSFESLGRSCRRPKCCKKGEVSSLGSKYSLKEELESSLWSCKQLAEKIDFVSFVYSIVFNCIVFIVFICLFATAP